MAKLMSVALPTAKIHVNYVAYALPKVKLTPLTWAAADIVLVSMVRTATGDHAEICDMCLPCRAGGYQRSMMLSDTMWRSC